MKKTLFAIVIFALFTGLGFAATGSMNSKLSDSTQGLFKNDVDNFSDVNEWDTVKPENIFGALGYSGGNIDFGLAKQFENYYLAGTFNGNFSSFTAGSIKNEPEVGDSTQTKTLKSDNTNNFNFSFLYGWKNMSIKFVLNYNVTAIDNKTVDAETESITNSNKFIITPSVYFGINDKTLKNWDADYYAYLGLYNNVDRSKTIVSDDHETSSYNGYSNLSIGGGMLLQKPLKDLGTQDFDVTGNINFDIYPSTAEVNYNAVSAKNEDTKISGRSYFGIKATPKYTVTLPLADNIEFKSAVYGTVSFYTSKSPESYTVGDSDAIYYSTRTTNTGIDISANYIDLGLTYKFKKPFAINLGAYFNLPSISLSTEKEESLDNKGKVTDTTKTTEFSFDRAYNSTVHFSSGFTYTPSSKISLDCSCNFVSDLLSSTLSSNFSTGNGTSIWNTANGLLIHNFTIQLSMKL